MSLCGDEGLTPEGAVVDHLRYSIAMGHGLDGWSRIFDWVGSHTGSRFNLVATCRPAGGASFLISERMTTDLSIYSIRSLKRPRT